LNGKIDLLTHAICASSPAHPSKSFGNVLAKELTKYLNRREQAWDMGDKNQSVFPPNQNNLKHGKHIIHQYFFPP